MGLLGQNESKQHTFKIKKIRDENTTATKENRQRKPSEGMHMNLLTSMSSEFKNHGG